ncbi:MAG: patatin-like phospholipase family protein [Candidatus Gygaella obscura]|nr:patatin-like phospholipase family protein [Candidatus Gygaella obscura]
MINPIRVFKPRIGLALGGGGVRAFAHIGILKVLEENKVPIHALSGISMGSIIAAIYALGIPIDKIEKKLLDIAGSKAILSLEKFSTSSEIDEKKLVFQKFVRILKNLYLWNVRGARKWLVRFDKILPFVESLIGNKTFADTKIPFYCVACDLATGEEVIINKGKLIDAVLASSALPGVFPPVKLEGKLLVDAGILGSIPTWVFDRKDVDFVLAANVGGNIYHKEFNTGLDILFQADLITSHKLDQEVLRYADFVIDPAVHDVLWSEFSQAGFCIEQGKLATKQNMRFLKKTIRGKYINPFFNSKKKVEKYT